MRGVLFAAYIAVLGYGALALAYAGGLHKADKLAVTNKDCFVVGSRLSDFLVPDLRTDLHLVNKERIHYSIGKMSESPE